MYNIIDLLHLIAAPQLSGGWWHNCSTKTRQAGRANEQSIYYLMRMLSSNCWRIVMYYYYQLAKCLSTGWLLTVCHGNVKYLHVLLLLSISLIRIFKVKIINFFFKIEGQEGSEFGLSKAWIDTMINHRVGWQYL